MMNTAAIIAHFDPNHRLDPSFRQILEIFRAHCDRIILVSTSELAPSDIPDDPQITTILRPNIGYDFYSYRVGIDTIHDLGGCQRLFLVNSSFLVMDPARFHDLLAEMCERLDTASLVGVTESRQWAWHLQSYLLLLGREVLVSAWFNEWLGNVLPQNSKLETILAGELGLSSAALANKVAASAVFQPSRRDKLMAGFAWAYRLWRNERWAAVSQLLRAFQEFNPAHFAAHALAARYGFLKTELIRDNPHQLNLDWIEPLTVATERETLRTFIEHSRHHYRRTGTGLSVVSDKGSGLPSFRLVCSGPMARPGVRAAVIIHIFYPELIEDLATLLHSLIVPFDLIVTTPHESAVPLVFNRLGPLAKSVAIAVCENRGRDIGPFIAIHRRGLLDTYAAVLKLHTKRSRYSEHGNVWRRRLFNGLCGNNVGQEAITLLEREQVGIVGPHEYYLSHPHFWGADRDRTRALLSAAGITLTPEGPRLGFFGGSMFWFKPAALAPLHAIPEALLDFEPEQGQQDGTLAHAFERIFCDIARHVGYTATSLPLKGRDLIETDTDSNTVPVLENP